jgi:hypothetical protein
MDQKSSDSAGAAIENEVCRKEDEFYAALRDAFDNGNRAGLDAVLAPEYTNTEADGNVVSKDKLIDDCTNGTYKVDKYELLSPMKVSVFSLCTAVVTCKDRLIGARLHKKTNGYPTIDVSGDYQWTDFWAKDEAGHWVCLASHDSKL